MGAIQPAEINWEDVEPRNALRQVYELNKKYGLSELILSMNWISYGYIYIIRHGNDFFAAMNTHEFDRARYTFPRGDFEFLKIPITEDEEKLKKVMLGVFVDAVKIKSLTDN